MRKSPDQKFIVGMVYPERGPRVTMFTCPVEYTKLADAELHASTAAQKHNKPFEVFKRVSSFAPSHPPIVKTEYK